MTAGGAAAAPAGATLGADASGPAVAALYHRLLAAIFLAAWASLGVQVDVLIGSRGLLPATAFLAGADAQRLGLAELPTVFWLNASDTALRAGVWVGAALALAALLGIRPRLCTAAGTALYLSYVTVGRTFFSFQWDNLLIECGVLAAFLPTDRPAPAAHLLFRILLFKLYWESGIAKWQSHLGDWQDGTAMMFYYETAPLPAWPAWYAHHLPAWWHHLESRAVLVLELVVPFCIFATRRLRLFTFAVFTIFQLTNALTANYGFFVYLALALHVFLLADRDVQWITTRLPELWPPPRRRPRTGWAARAGRVAAVVAVAMYIAVSLLDALAAFAPMPRRLYALTVPLLNTIEPLRAINTYHLFGHITRDRIEPEMQIESEGAWRAYDLRHKPGPLERAPDFVAPHQPRLDFQLWFYGLSFQHGTPPYVSALLDRLCHDPAAVQSVFAEPLPTAPQAVRIAFWSYRFSPLGTERAWWTREPVASTSAVSCN